MPEAVPLATPPTTSSVPAAVFHPVVDANPPLLTRLVSVASAASTVGIENFAAFNYTALGHLHACQTGDNKVRYSGSLLKYSFNEVNQTKGVHIVDLDAEGAISVETVSFTPTHDLACLRGTFDDLLKNPRQELTQHFLQVTLEDEHPILDAKYRLEQVYPHILHLEYSRLQKLSTDSIQSGSHQELGVKELFTSFFEQISERSLTEAETTILNAAIDEAAQAERRS